VVAAGGPGRQVARVGQARLGRQGQLAEQGVDGGPGERLVLAVVAVLRSGHGTGMQGRHPSGVWGPAVDRL
jgi:hypothetical protein